jgi:hypothetical protein
MAVTSDVLLTRLRNQRLAGDGFERAEDAVRWFGAVQGQDVLASLWALGLRVPGSTEGEIEKAIEDGGFSAPGRCGERSTTSPPKTRSGCST